MSRVECHAASCRNPRKRGPIYATPGAVRVKVYHGSNRGKDAYFVSYSLGGRRKRLMRADLDDAKREAQAVSRQIAQGRISATGVTIDERDALAVARRLLAPLGVPLIAAVEEYAAAKAKLPNGVSLLMAAEDTAIRHSSRSRSPRVMQVVEEFLDAKEKAGLSVRHLDTLRMHCRQFAGAFQVEIDGIRASEIELWLHQSAPKPRSYKNYRGSLTNLFSFARRRGYLPRGTTTEAQLTEQTKTVAPPVEVLSPEEFERVLRQTEGESQLYAALGGFAGLRSSELLRLHWEDVRADHIVVTAGKAKTAQRRTVRICDALQKWIDRYRKTHGAVFSRSRSEHVFLKHVRRILPRWPANGLRHSFVSYSVALTNNVPAVALEAGNSPTMIHRHYRQITLRDRRLITEELAKRWFGIYPPEHRVAVPQ